MATDFIKPTGRASGSSLLRRKSYITQHNRGSNIPSPCHGRGDGRCERQEAGTTGITLNSIHHKEVLKCFFIKKSCKIHKRVLMDPSHPFPSQHVLFPGRQQI